MFNRTLQLQDLVEGRPCNFQYNTEDLITTRDNKFLLNQTARVPVETTFSVQFTMFMDQIDAVKQMIKTIDEGATSITKLMSLSNEVMSNKQSSDVSSNMNALIDKTNCICTQCKEAITTLEKHKDEGSSTTENRMRNNYVNVVIKHFKNAIKRYQDAQVEFKKMISERAKRQIRLIYPNMDERELDQIITETKGQQTVEQIAKSNFLGNLSLKDAVSNIQGKYNDILVLEQSMEQLKQMMVELAGVVRYQGELIDQIEHNATKAVDYTGRANEQLTKAKINKRRGGKLMMWVTMAVLLVGISIMIPILLKIT